ncbi:MAG: amidohydrolase family protein [Myxococcota bacterium]
MRRAAPILVLVAGLLAALLWWQRAPTAPSPERSFADISKIDVHVHVPPTLVSNASRLLKQHGIRLAFNASGGHPGQGLAANAAASEAVRGALPPYCHLDWRYAGAPDWENYVQQALSACRAQGAVGLKIFKALGLGYRTPEGLLAVDDPRLDVAFEEAGRLGLVVLIHTGDPKAFFEAPTPDNERYAELQAHPSWSFYGPRPDGGEWPSWRDLLDQLDRRIGRHPQTTFLGAHFGNAPEEPALVGRMLDAHPNYVIETGARIPEIGRHNPEQMRAFFRRYRDRILFGTDTQVIPGGFVLGSAGTDIDTIDRVPAFFHAHWRYFETNDRDFAHPTPIQGDWTIDGIGLERAELEAIYFRNAERVFGRRIPPDAPSEP